LEIPTADGTGFMNVEIDDNIVFSVDQSDQATYATYAQVTLDVSAYADGGVHNVEFYSETDAGAVTNFFVDDVVLDVVEGGGCTTLGDLTWLSVSPTSGTTASGDTDTVDVTFDSASLSAGVYTGTLCINSNDPDEAQVQVPVTLTVNEGTVTPSIVLTKTVGLDPDVCALTDSIIIPAGGGGTEVTYCYMVENTGNVTFTNHTLVDTELGTILTNEPVDLGPGATYFLTRTVLITQTTVNTATWTATAGTLGSGGISATATDSATVTRGNPTDVNISTFDGVEPMALAPVWLAALLVLIMGLALVIRRKAQG
jgi:hypothetical protein